MKTTTDLTIKSLFDTFNKKCVLCELDLSCTGNFGAREVQLKLDLLSPLSPTEYFGAREVQLELDFSCSK